MRNAMYRAADQVETGDKETEWMAMVPIVVLKDILVGWYAELFLA